MMRACNVIEPVSGTKDPTLFGAVLRNSMLVEDSFEKIDDSARADVSQCAYDRKPAVEGGN